MLVSVAVRLGPLEGRHPPLLLFKHGVLDPFSFWELRTEPFCILIRGCRLAKQMWCERYEGFGEDCRQGKRARFSQGAGLSICFGTVKKLST